jgi:polar amino acid transport system permease protein
VSAALAPATSPAGPPAEAGAPASGAQAAIEAVPVPRWGRKVAAAAALALAAALLYALATNPNIKWATVGHYLADPGILSGLWVTVELTVLAMVLGIVLGVLSAVMALSENPVLRGLSLAYTWFFRGTPLLVQIIFWFNLALLFPHLSLGPLDVKTNTLVTPFVAALLGLALNEGAYMSEIVRAGIGAVDRGQTEAAHALGFRPGQTMRRIVLPQAMRVIVPPTGNETITMLKNTSLVAVIAAQDLLTRAQAIYSRTFEVVELLIVVSLWYLLLTTVASVGQYHLEKRFARGFAGGASHDTKETSMWRKIASNLVTGRRGDRR